MNRWKTAALSLAALYAAQAAWLGLRDARAEVPVAAEPAAERPSHHLTCRVFALDLRQPSPIETQDRTSEIGQWVGELEDRGHILHGLDFEIGQKSTGYPQGYVQVCVTRG